MRLMFPADRAVGVLQWATRAKERGPALAISAVEVPDHVEIHFEVEHVIDFQREGDDGWRLQANLEPVDLTFLADLPPTAITDLVLHRVVAESLPSIVHLAPGLRRLYLPWCELGDDALSSIARLTNLIYLQTYGNDFTDDGVQQLAALQHLQHLYLEEQTLTARAFAFAGDLPLLRRLGLQDVAMTGAELSELRRRMPRVDIG